MSKISKDLYDKIWNILNEKQKADGPIPIKYSTPEEREKERKEYEKKKAAGLIEPMPVNYRDPVDFTTGQIAVPIPVRNFTPEEREREREKREKERKEFEKIYTVYPSTIKRGVEEYKKRLAKDLLNKLNADKLEKTSTAKEMEQELKKIDAGSIRAEPQPQPTPQDTQGSEQLKFGLQPKLEKIPDSREPRPQPKATEIPPVIPSLDRPVNIPPTPTKPGDFGYISPPSERFPKIFGKPETKDDDEKKAKLKESVINLVRSKFNISK